MQGAVSEEYVGDNVLMALKTVSGLQAGRTRFHETKPVKPVPDAHVDAILEHLPEAMVGIIDREEDHGPSLSPRACLLALTVVAAFLHHRPRHRLSFKQFQVWLVTVEAIPLPLF